MTSRVLLIKIEMKGIELIVIGFEILEPIGSTSCFSSSDISRKFDCFLVQ